MLYWIVIRFNFSETCIRTQSHSSPWIRLDLRRSYHVREIFISNQDHKNGWDMWDFEARVGKSLDNEGNDNALCSPLYTLIPGQIGTIVCKNNTVGRYVNVRIGRNGSHLSLCEIAVIGVGKLFLLISKHTNTLKVPFIPDYFFSWNPRNIIGYLSNLCSVNKWDYWNF